MFVVRIIGAGEAGFEAYIQRQFVTESININSLANHHIWSTIKTLPATLPEPRSQAQVPIIALLEPRNGVTDAVSQPAFDFRHGGWGQKSRVCGSRTAVLRWVRGVITLVIL